MKESYLNESCRTCEWVISHVWISHVTRCDMKWEWHDSGNRSLLIMGRSRWVMSHIWMSHIWMSHVTRMNESCHNTWYDMDVTASVVVHSRRRSDIWISRLDSFPVHPFKWRGLPFTPMKTCLKFGGIPWKLVWKLRGLSENWIQILAVVVIFSQISYVSSLVVFLFHLFFWGRLAAMRNLFV